MMCSETFGLSTFSKFRPEHVLKIGPVWFSGLSNFYFFGSLMVVGDYETLL